MRLYGRGQEPKVCSGHSWNGWRVLGGAETPHRERSISRDLVVILVPERSNPYGSVGRVYCRLYAWIARRQEGHTSWRRSTCPVCRPYTKSHSALYPPFTYCCANPQSAPVLVSTLGSKPCLTCMVIVSFPFAVCMMGTVQYQLSTETENGAAP